MLCPCQICRHAAARSSAPKLPKPNPTACTSANHSLDMSATSAHNVPTMMLCNLKCVILQAEPSHVRVGLARAYLQDSGNNSARCSLPKMYMAVQCV